MSSALRLAPYLALLAAAGCAPTPRLAVAPEILSRDWGVEDGSRSQSSSVSLPRSAFWHSFGSRDLERLIAAALADNPGLDAVRARVDRARAETRIADASRYPTIESSFNAEGAHNQNQASPVYTYNGVSVGLDVSYDVDLFGANTATRRASRARYAGLRFDAEAAALVLQADVARVFVQLAVTEERIALADRQYAAAKDVQRIVAIRVNAGSGDDTEAARQMVEVEQVFAFRTTLVEQRRHLLTALALLVGGEAPSFAVPPIALASLLVPTVDPGAPTMLIVRRPDIRAAEARIAAARGDVDAARRAFLPSFKLSASGLASAVGFLGPIGLTTSAGAALLAPIFEGGRLRGQLETASAGQRESVALYRQTLLGALGEMTDALASTRLADEREASLQRALIATRRNVRTAEVRYREGEADLAVLIGAQRDVYAAEDARTLATQDRFVAAIDLFRATGGAVATDAPTIAY
jgi:multidrug efflux system outer membrane protein